MFEQLFLMRLLRKSVRNWFSMLFYLYLISIIAYSAGGYNAKHKTDFIVITGSSELVVLKKYNSYLLSADFDKSSKIVTSNFHKIDIAKELKDFKYMRIGPLVAKGLSQ